MHCVGNIPDSFVDGMACKGIAADGGEEAWLGSLGYGRNPEGTVFDCLSDKSTESQSVTHREHFARQAPPSAWSERKRGQWCLLKGLFYAGPMRVENNRGYMSECREERCFAEDLMGGTAVRSLD